MSRGGRGGESRSGVPGGQQSEREPGTASGNTIGCTKVGRGPRAPRGGWCRLSTAPTEEDPRLPSWEIVRKGGNQRCVRREKEGTLTRRGRRPLTRADVDDDHQAAMLTYGIFSANAGHALTARPPLLSHAREPRASPCPRSLPCGRLLRSRSRRVSWWCSRWRRWKGWAARPALQPACVPLICLLASSCSSL